MPSACWTWDAPGHGIGGLGGRGDRSHIIVGHIGSSQKSVCLCGKWCPHPVEVFCFYVELAGHHAEKIVGPLRSLRQYGSVCMFSIMDPAVWFLNLKSWKQLCVSMILNPGSSIQGQGSRISNPGLQLGSQKFEVPGTGFL
jgi:hypothetical protein